MNEFLWESTTPDHFIEKLYRDFACDAIFATHTGIPWTRRLGGDRLFVNVGVLGRPPNDGTTSVTYALLSPGAEGLAVEIVRVNYEYRALAREMREEELPLEFVETIETGWWTTCLEILPGKERARGKY
jgi:hypothetical protein